MEISIEDLISRIFYKKPQPEKSIQLQFVENLDLKEMFEFLLTFFTEGAKFRYGNMEGKLELDKWTNKEVDLMKEYFKSIGFKLYVNSVNHKEKNFNYSLYNYNYKEVKINEKTKLNELKIAFKCQDFIHVIYFDII